MNAGSEILRRDAEEALARIDPSGELRAAAQHVVDLDADSSTCPACMGTIPRGHARCPDCGLRFA